MASQTLTVAANADDGHWYSGGLNPFGTSYALVGLASGFNIHAWASFILTGNVAQGATVNSATFSGLTNFAGQDVGWQATAKFVDQANPSNPADVSAADALWAAAASGSGNSFTDSDWTDGGGTAFSLTITQAFQELVNARALTSGNRVMLILHCPLPSGTNKFRKFNSYEASPATLPTLAFDYTESTGNRRRRILLAA